VRGLEKNGGRLMLRSHVESIKVEGERATGVVLRGGRRPRRRGGVRRVAGGWGELVGLRRGGGVTDGKVSMCTGL
jgi:hypothetical protein